MIHARFTLGILAVAAGLATANAQLAITEAMSSAADTFITEGTTNGVAPNSDYWELTNFGTNEVALDGFKMADEGAGLGGAYSTPFEGLAIGAGETIVFVQDSVNTTAQAVRDWWGAGLAGSVRIIFYHNYGLSAQGDGMSLWDANDNLVDHAHVEAATKGRSFTYDPATGIFGVLSTNGVGGAFQAATTDDVGSPGVTTGPVPLTFTFQPTNLTVISGSSASFAVAARGLPRPKYQWFFKGNPIDGATGTSLSIPNALSGDAGAYSVQVTNGLESLTSSNATLTVNPAPTPPVVQIPPKDLVAYVGQTASFSVQAQGNPAPTYQWQRNGVNLAGQTTNQLFLYNVVTSDSADYSVIVANPAGSTNVQASLLVTPVPRLVITEVQSGEATPATAANADWWELSNLGSFAVDLFGYRWDDNSANLAVAFTVTNHIVIQPGESVIFVEGLSSAQFKHWWGESNLPPALKVIRYDGNGLGLSSTSASGDQVNLWNQATTANGDPIGKVAAVTLSTSPGGRTFIWNPDTGIFWGNSTDGLSTNGLNGAFTSAFNGDVGSPGWVVEKMILQIAPNGGGFDVTWNSTEGRSYTLFYKNSLADAAWTPLSTVTASDDSTTVSDAAAVPYRFYRLVVNLP